MILKLQVELIVNLLEAPILFGSNLPALFVLRDKAKQPVLLIDSFGLNRSKAGFDRKDFSLQKAAPT